MHSLNEWFELICKSYTNPPVIHRGVALPGFPPDQLQRETTGDAGRGTLTEAFNFYEDCKTEFARMGTPILETYSLLDFGVGWGRVARFFLQELPISNVFGIDVTPEFIDICKRSFRTNNFIVNKPFPPTPIPTSRFEIIVGYSIFSHLSEQACELWMLEFHRILAPGGVLALSTRSRQFFDYCESLRKSEVTGYPLGLSKIFANFDEARARYDRGEFVHSNIEGVTGGGEMNSSFYGETFIPEEYARVRYSRHFKLERFLFNPRKQLQPIMFFRRI
jgi:SAM-dependent methyltransferase